jgi:hypothetical protein
MTNEGPDKVYDSWEDIIDVTEIAGTPSPASSLRFTPNSNLIENKEFSGMSTYKPQLKVLARSPSKTLKSSDGIQDRNKAFKKEPVTLSRSNRERLYKESKDRIFGSPNKPKDL